MSKENHPNFHAVRFVANLVESYCASIRGSIPPKDIPFPQKLLLSFVEKVESHVDRLSINPGSKEDENSKQEIRLASEVNDEEVAIALAKRLNNTKIPLWTTRTVEYEKVTIDYDDDLCVFDFIVTVDDPFVDVFDLQTISLFIRGYWEGWLAEATS